MTVKTQGIQNVFPPPHMPRPCILATPPHPQAHPKVLQCP